MGCFPELEPWNAMNSSLRLLGEKTVRESNPPKTLTICSLVNVANPANMMEERRLIRIVQRTPRARRQEILGIVVVASIVVISIICDGIAQTTNLKLVVGLEYIGDGDLSTQRGGQKDKSLTGDMSENNTPEEESVCQLEQLLATMRLNMEKVKLQKSNVGTVVADQVSSVGPVICLDVEVEGYLVQAVVDTGAQLTIISRDQLHQIAKSMQKSGCGPPMLVTPNAKLYRCSGSGHSELTITAEAQLQVTLDGHQVTVPLLVQPGSDIPCLLGTNVLPLLGVKFLRSNGICLVKVTEDTDGCCDPSERPEDITVVPPLCTFTPTATQMVFPDQPVLKSGSNTSSQPPLQAEVCIVRSTFISPRMGKMLEVEIEVKSPPVKDVYFEPSCCSALKGLEIAEAVLISQQDGHLFIPIENHASLSQCLHPGTCIGRATQLPNAWEKFQSPRAAGTKFVNGDYH